MGDLAASSSEILPLEALDLDCGWEFKQTDDENENANAWLPVRRIPSTVHQDLIDNKL